jgi:hypothetical protein
MPLQLINKSDSDTNVSLCHAADAASLFSPTAALRDAPMLAGVQIRLDDAPRSRCDLPKWLET